MISRLLLLSTSAVVASPVSTDGTMAHLTQVLDIAAPHITVHEAEEWLSQFDTASTGTGLHQRSRHLLAGAPVINLPSSLTGDIIKPEAYNGWINGGAEFGAVTWSNFTSTISRRGDSASVVINYVKARGSGTRGGVIISVGHTEPAEKYAEQIHDLLSAGFSPVYALDHRGQGRSTRLLADDSFKSHVESASDFISDFRVFVSRVDSEMIASGEGSGKRFLHCHSMGCAIGLTFLMEEHYAQRPTIFNAVAANAPLIQPNTDPFPYGVATVIGDAMLLLGLDTSYPPTKGKPFDELYVDNTVKPDRQRTQTARCQARRDTGYPTGHYGLCLGDVTARFAAEFFGMYNAFVSFQNVKAKLSTPVLLQQAKDTGDGSDGIVINTEQTKFCTDACGSCTLTSYSESEHNIWFEKDSIRTTALNEAYNFYDAHAGSVAPQGALPPTCYWRTWCSLFGCDCIHDCNHPAARC